MRQHLNKPLKKSDLKAFIRWLETKPAYQKYNYLDGKNCLIAQFLKSLGFKQVSVGPASFEHSTAIGSLPYKLNSIAVDGETTFGAALLRAKEKLRDWDGWY